MYRGFSSRDFFSVDQNLLKYEGVSMYEGKRAAEGFE